MKRRRSERASIFIAALWVLFTLSMLAVAVNLRVSPQIDLASRLMTRVTGRALAMAGFERAVLELQNNSDEEYTSYYGTWSSNAAAFKDIQLGGGTYSLINRPGPEPGYGLIDEESRFNINKAPVEAAKKFFVIVADIGEDAAGELAACIKDWRDADDQPEKGGAESFHYQSLSIPYSCKNADFETIDELLLVKGMTPQILDKLRDKITLFGSGAVNINTADEAVLMGLGMSSDTAHRIVALRRDDKEIFKEPRQAIELLVKKGGLSTDETALMNSLVGNNLLAARSDCFRGSSVGRTGGKDHFGIDFVYDRAKRIVKYWKED